MSGKFKRGLVSEVKTEKKEEERIEALIEKHDIKRDNENQKIVVVEQSHLFVDAMKLILNILVYVLAFVGLLCLVYPTTRITFFEVFSATFDQLQSYMSL